MLRSEHIIPTFGEYFPGAKVYKVSRTRRRVNAKRRLAGRILAANKDEAIKIFMKIFENTEKDFYQLHSGDWRETYYGS